MKTLISMTDFVLEQKNKVEASTYERANSIMVIAAANIFNYAKFLKQPLKLEMFVPCDEGNVLEKPTRDNFLTHGICRTDDFTKALKEYKKAKEKVLFEGFEVDKDGDIVHKGKKLIVNTETCRINQTVESYVGKNLTLTPTALKQIGL